MSLLRRNIDLGAPLDISPWRKVAIGTWRTAGDPSVYGTLDVDAAPALAYIEKLRASTGLRVTLTHFAGKAVAEVLRRHPEINCILRWGRIYPRKTVDVFYQVASDDAGRDLSGMTVRDAASKSLEEIAREMDERVKAIKQNRDKSFAKMKGLMGSLPGLLSRYVLDFAGFIMYSLNLWSPLLGSPRDPFGSLMITNVGSLGLQTAFAPLVPYSRVPLLIALGAARDMPVVRDGRVEVARLIRLCVTFDHRLIDGVHAANMSRAVQKIFADPETELR